MDSDPIVLKKLSLRASDMALLRGSKWLNDNVSFLHR